MQISPAIWSARSAISAAPSEVFWSSARAAASAYDPPDPIAAMPSSGSMMSPLPDTTSTPSGLPTRIIASSRRSTRSVRQSLASSTTARRTLPG